MAKPRVMVLRAAGINCDEETQLAWTMAGAECDVVHVNRLIENPAALDRYALVTVPGGFSYGDDLGAGRIFGTRLRLHLGEALRKFVDRGRCVLGVCNGFQVLVEAGLLTANDAGERVALAFNRNGHYTCRWISALAETDRCIFLEKGRTYFLPMAHAEGRFAVAEAERLDPSRVALRYVEGVERIGPVSPSGSFANVAGLIDATGRVFGLMPHPERYVEVYHLPFWTAEKPAGDPDGLAMFKSALSRL